MQSRSDVQTASPERPELGALTPGLRESRRSRLARQVFRFGVVGALNTIVDLAVLNVLIFATGKGSTGLGYAAYKTVAFFCAVLNSYLLNRGWTFERVANKSQMLEGSQFMFISVLGWIVNVGSSWYVATYTQPFAGINPKAWPSVAALVGTAFSLGFNFIGYRFWVFAHRRH